MCVFSSFDYAQTLSERRLSYQVQNVQRQRPEYSTLKLTSHADGQDDC